MRGPTAAARVEDPRQVRRPEVIDAPDVRPGAAIAHPFGCREPGPTGAAATGTVDASGLAIPAERADRGCRLREVTGVCHPDDAGLPLAWLLGGRECRRYAWNMASTSPLPSGSPRDHGSDTTLPADPGAVPGDATTAPATTTAPPGQTVTTNAPKAAAAPQPELKPAGEATSRRPLLRIGHSPDPDDAFMWFPLTGIDGGPPLIDTGRFRFQAVMRDIETLNRHAELAIGGGLTDPAGTATVNPDGADDAPTIAAAGETGATIPGETGGGGEVEEDHIPDPAHGPHTPLPATPAEAEPLPAEPLEITAISIGQYPFVAHRYALTACGASLGLGYGPRLVARAGRGITLDRLRSDRDLRMAIPGLRTSAFLAYRLLIGKPPGVVEVIPFDLIPEQVADGSFDVGLIIHEGQLTFGQFGLELVADLGALFNDRFHLPLPLGGNAILRDLEARYGPGTLEEITATLQRSILYAMEHREQAIDFALRHARGMTRELADEFVAMYVNRHTVEYGDAGRAAVERFLAEAERAGLAPAPTDGLRIVSPAGGA